jgi:hypothetical protein
VLPKKCDAVSSLVALLLSASKYFAVLLFYPRSSFPRHRVTPSYRYWNYYYYSWLVPNWQTRRVVAAAAAAAGVAVAVAVGQAVVVVRYGYGYGYSRSHGQALAHLALVLA